MKLSKIFPNTQNTAFLKLIACLCLALLCLQQCQSLTCYDCLYLDEFPDLTQDGYIYTCLNPKKDLADQPMNKTCSSSAIYCEKRYMKVEYSDGVISNYLIRECSQVTKQFSFSLPVCYDMPPTESWNSAGTTRTLSDDKILKKKRQKGKSDTECLTDAECNYTTTSRTCVCAGRDLCNDGPEYQITAIDGTVITIPRKPTLAPGGAREVGNVGQDTTTVAKAPSILPPHSGFYQFLASAALIFAYYLTTATATAPAK